MRPTVAIIILAAGASRRMGQAKQLLKLDGVSLVRRAVNTALQLHPEKLIVVLGAYKEEIENEIRDLPGRRVFNENWKTGMGSSLAKGIEALQQDPEPVEACLVMLSDQPFVESRHLKYLLTAFVRLDKKIIAATYRGRTGVPAIFHHSLFPRLQESLGDQGARNLIKKHPEWVQTMALDVAAHDIDTPEDYLKAQAKMEEE